MSISKHIAAIAGMVTIGAPAVAQSGSGWHGIGQGATAADAGSVTVAGHGEPRDREIMFCIEGHNMRLNEAVLHFEGGGTQSIRINERIADGGCSRGKTLSGHNHSVQSADVSYDQAILAGGTAHVQLFVR